ncbi:MAG: hypothetical protein ABJ208_00455, partial [Rhodopirellula bahusiensis]
MTVPSQHAFPAIHHRVFANLLALAFGLTISSANAQDDPPQPVTIKVPTPKAWVGQRLPFSVQVRAPGSFVGATSFSLPQIPRTVI